MTIKKMPLGRATGAAALDGAGNAISIPSVASYIHLDNKELSRRDIERAYWRARLVLEINACRKLLAETATTSIIELAAVYPAWRLRELADLRRISEPDPRAPEPYLAAAAFRHYVDSKRPRQTTTTMTQDLLTIASEHIRLQRRGKSYVGLCPFHGERTPSFTIWPHINAYRCFGCGRTGNAQTFTRLLEEVRNDRTA